jgi:hypothetical protein
VPSVIDLLGEIGSSLPYLYRGWCWLLSGTYRNKVKDEYKRHSSIYIGFDISMSVLFFSMEVWAIYIGTNCLLD